MKNIFKHFTKRTAYLSLFSVLYLAVAFTSTLHAVQFFGLTNENYLAILLAVSFEIGQAAVLLSLLTTKSERGKITPWVLMCIFTTVQIIGNIYSSYKYAVLNSLDNLRFFKEPIFIWTSDLSDNVANVIVTYISSSILPIAALLLTSVVANYLSDTDKTLDEPVNTIDASKHTEPQLEHLEISSNNNISATTNESILSENNDTKKLETSLYSYYKQDDKKDLDTSSYSYSKQDKAKNLDLSSYSYSDISKKDDDKNLDNSSYSYSDISKKDEAKNLDLSSYSYSNQNEAKNLDTSSHSYSDISKKDDDKNLDNSSYSYSDISKKNEAKNLDTSSYSYINNSKKNDDKNLDVSSYSYSNQNEAKNLDNSSYSYSDISKKDEAKNLDISSYSYINNSKKNADKNLDVSSYSYSNQNDVKYLNTSSYSYINNSKKNNVNAIETNSYNNNINNSSRDTELQPEHLETSYTNNISYINNIHPESISEKNTKHFKESKFLNL